MKIAIFSDTFPPSATNGVANVACQMAKNFAELGHRVMVFTVAKKTKSNPVGIESENLKIVRLPSLPAPVYSGERITIPFLISLPHLKKFKPDIIHIHTPFFVGWEGILVAKILKVPLIGTHHTFYDHYLKHVKLDYGWMKKFSWKYTVRFYNFCDLVLNPSRALTNVLIEKGLKCQVGVMQNSIDTDLFQPISGAKEKKEIKKHFGINGKSAVYMGRLSYEKNIDQVVEAFALMLKKMPDLKLMIVGDGPERKNLGRLVDDLKIKNNVIFTGYLYDRKELIRALQANDVFLTASKSENMPLSIVEAMAVGLPLVMVKEKGLAELIREGVNGFFSQTDDPPDMAKKTLAILSSPKLLKKFGQGSRLMAMECSKEKITNLLIESYKKLTSLKTQ